jgi:hypothetical protein
MNSGNSKCEAGMLTVHNSWVMATASHYAQAFFDYVLLCIILQYF